MLTNYIRDINAILYCRKQCLRKQDLSHISPYIYSVFFPLTFQATFQPSMHRVLYISQYSSSSGADNLVKYFKVTSRRLNLPMKW